MTGAWLTTGKLATDPQARPDPYTGTMGAEDRLKNERERQKIRQEIDARLSRIEDMLASSLNGRAECCARIGAIEREIDRRHQQ